MRASVDGVEIEGTPEEIAQFLEAIRPARGLRSKPTERVSDACQDEMEPGNQEGITDKFAYRALRRLPLSVAQKTLLTTLRNASPNWVLSSDLQSALDCSPTSLGGVFGGLGRRTSATKGHQIGYNLWDWKWDEDEGEWSYRLPDAVLSALTRVGI